MSTPPPSSADTTVAPIETTCLTNAIGANFLPETQDKTDKGGSKPVPPVTVASDTNKNPGQWAFKYDPKSQQLTMEVEVVTKAPNGMPALILKEYKSIIDPASITGLITWLATVKSAIEKSKAKPG